MATAYKMIDKQVMGDRFEWSEFLPQPGKPRLLRVVQYFNDGYFDVLTGTEAELVAHMAKRYGQEEAEAIVAAMKDETGPEDPQGSPEALRLTDKPLDASAHEIARTVEQEAAAELAEVAKELAERGKVYAAEAVLRAFVRVKGEGVGRND